MLNPLYTCNSLMGTLADSKDPDKMQHNAAFYQDFICLLGYLLGLKYMIIWKFQPVTP